MGHDHEHDHEQAWDRDASQEQERGWGRGRGRAEGEGEGKGSAGWDAVGVPVVTWHRMDRPSPQAGRSRNIGVSRECSRSVEGGVRLGTEYHS
jgi:hypothetical protein